MVTGSSPGPVGGALRRDRPRRAGAPPREPHQALGRLCHNAERTSCSTTIAAGLLKEGDFKGDSAEVTWHFEHPQELDPGVGWPWFRDLRMNLYGFQIDDIENSGLACNQLDNDALIEGPACSRRLPSSLWRQREVLPCAVLATRRRRSS